MILISHFIVEKNHTRVGNKIRKKMVIELSPRLGTNMARIVKVKKKDQKSTEKTRFRK
jgi:hypothetical protein